MEKSKTKKRISAILASTTALGAMMFSSKNKITGKIILPENSSEISIQLIGIFLLILSGVLLAYTLKK